MLPPFIIEQIRKREEEARPAHRPVVELPIPPRPRRESDPPAGEERGVVVIDLAGE